MATARSRVQYRVSAYNPAMPHPPHQAHPWHGIPAGEAAPEIINAFIEIVPGDTVKYEIDKASGHLKVDRPQKFSSLCPAPYGFIPRTYCGLGVGKLAAEKTSRPMVKGDGDPLDICVLTEKIFTHGAFLLRARPIGGLLMLDREEADDKIIAVLVDDPAFGHFRDLHDCPAPLIDRLRHYFLTYKLVPDAAGFKPGPVEIPQIYGREAAHEVIRKAMTDYDLEIAGA